MSGRPGIGEKRFSANKFHPLPGDMNNGQYTMANPNDATIDIPLTAVTSRNGTGARKTNTAVSSNEYSAEKGSKRPGPGRRKKTDGDRSYNEEDGEGHTLNQMGKFYNAVLNFSVVTRYFLFVSPLAILIAIPIVIGAIAAPNAAIGGVSIVWFFTWIEVVWIGLWVAKIVAHFLPFAFQLFAGIVSSGTQKYALILKSLEIPLSLVGWTLIALGTFIPIMTQNPDQLAAGDTAQKDWEGTVKNILFALLVCTLIFLAEKTLIQIISVSYHRKQYDFRIKESKHNVTMLGDLYEASRAMFPEYCKAFAEEDEIISATIIGEKKGHHRGDSVAPIRLIKNVGRNVGRVGDKVTAAFGNVAHEITGKNIFDAGSAHSVVVHALEKRQSSEALAKRIWMSFVVEGRDALFEDDIVEVMGAEHIEEAQECFHILDRDGNGDVSMEEMIQTVAEFGRVRKSIARSMHDVDQAIHVLDTLLLTVAMVIMVLVFVSFVTTGASTVIAAGATSLLSLSFVFSVTAQEVLGSCVFLFVKHPFDVGDRVEINEQELFVEEISLLYTVFRTVAEQRITQAANNVLNTTWIDNITRSKAMRERVSLFVDFGTTFADIQLLKTEMERFVRDKENSRDFQPDIDVEVIGVGNMDKLELRIEIRHKSNWSNETIRAARRSKFMCALVLAIRKVPIVGPAGNVVALGDPTNPSYSVAITDDKAKEYREKAAEKKDESRLVPKSHMNELRSTMSPTAASHSTGIDPLTVATNNGSLQQRSGGSIKKMTEADFVGALNNRPTGYDLSRSDEAAQFYKVPNAAASAISHEQLSPIPDGSDDQTSLLRAPSTGRRKGNGDSAVLPPHKQLSPLLIPPSVTGGAGASHAAGSVETLTVAPSGSFSAQSHNQHAPTDRFDIPSYYSTAISIGGGQHQQTSPSGGNNPFETSEDSNNPYAGHYGNPTTEQDRPAPPPPQYQSPAPGSAANLGRPAGSQTPGNAFSQQQHQPQ